MKKLLFLIAIIAFFSTTVPANVSFTSDNSSIVIIDNDNDMNNTNNLDEDKDKDKKKKKKKRSKRNQKSCGDKPCSSKCGDKVVDPGCKGEGHAAKSTKTCCPTTKGSPTTIESPTKKE